MRMRGLSVRAGACEQVIGQMREKLRLHCAPVQLPLGLEDAHRGLVDLVAMRAFHFEGPNGETITEVGACVGALCLAGVAAGMRACICSGSCCRAGRMERGAC